MFGFREYRESVDRAIWSRMHESASTLMRCGRNVQFDNNLMFWAFFDAISSYAGPAQYLWRFCTFSGKLVGVEIVLILDLKKTLV